MKLIATTDVLQAELRRLQGVARGPSVSRVRMAMELRVLALRVARETPYPQQDVKGSGEWAVYFETEDPKTIHRWKFHTEVRATVEAKKVQKQHGGYVTLMHKGREVSEIGAGGQIKNATAANVAARYEAKPR